MFDWTDYLTLARRLARERDEASQRSAISRAYYASYCTARNWLLSRGFVFPDHSQPHFHVWDEFQSQRQAHVWSSLTSPAHASAREVGRAGRRFRVKRNSADYDNTLPGLTQEVTVALARAEDIRLSISRLR